MRIFLYNFYRCTNFLCGEEKCPYVASSATYYFQWWHCKICFGETPPNQEGVSRGKDGKIAFHSTQAESDKVAGSNRLMAESCKEKPAFQDFSGSRPNLHVCCIKQAYRSAIITTSGRCKGYPQRDFRFWKDWSTRKNKSSNPQVWIFGTGFEWFCFAKKNAFPTKEDLDKWLRISDVWRSYFSVTLAALTQGTGKCRNHCASKDPEGGKMQTNAWQSRGQMEYSKSLPPFLITHSVLNLHSRRRCSNVHESAVRTWLLPMATHCPRGPVRWQHELLAKFAWAVTSLKIECGVLTSITFLQINPQIRNGYSKNTKALTE